MIFPGTINLSSPNVVATVTGLGECVISALNQTPAGAPCRQCTLIPSSIVPWDNCGPCGENNSCTGQVAFAVREIYGSKTFPQPEITETWRKCGPRYSVARVVCSVTRCVATMAQDGAPPGCDQELVGAVTLENDRTTVRQALAACLCAMSIAAPPLAREFVILSSTTMPELGGCAGTETEFLIGFPIGCACGQH